MVSISVRNFFAVGLMAILFLLFTKVIVNKYEILSPARDIVNMV